MFFDKYIAFAAHLMSKLLPSTCILCGYSTDRQPYICLACQHDLPILSQSCRQCAQFLHGSNLTTVTCGSCQQDPPLFDRTYALFPYEPPIIQLIIKLKFQQQISHAHAFAHLLIEKIRHEWYRHQPLPDIILPVPLHPKRLQERGFNQALEIAKPIAKSLHIPIDLHGITRSKHTAAQSGLPAAKRQQNLFNAFTVHRDYSSLSLAIIDDVVTTGHTMRELSKTLKDHGAKHIDVWCCARRG